MIDVYLGFGSNHGDRESCLRAGIHALAARGLRLVRCSPAVESPALLPAGSPWDWNRPFLNCIAHYRADPALAGAAGLRAVRGWIDEAQAQAGRPHASRWAPRPLDVDVLLWGDACLTEGKVTVPHPDLLTRNFVLSPLVALQPDLVLPGGPPVTVLEHSRALPHHIPLWMGIVNVTPDSFSDGGRYSQWADVRDHVDAMRASGVHVIDVGAESTRPGATPLAAAAEWERLAPVLERLLAHLGDDPLRPRVSVDTYHPEVAARCVEVGVDIINDVSGFASPAMLELAAASSTTTFVAMHNLGIPADRDVTLPADADPVDAVRRWIETRLVAWQEAGLPAGRTVIDPGIGFGKDALQSLRLLQNAGELARLGVRLLVGHSRKSFMKSFSGGRVDLQTRDLTTVGASLNLCAQGVDIIRVHDVAMHTAAYRGWTHLVATPLPPAERPATP